MDVSVVSCAASEFGTSQAFLDDDPTTAAASRILSAVKTLATELSGQGDSIQRSFVKVGTVLNDVYAGLVTLTDDLAFESDRSDQSSPQLPPEVRLQQSARAQIGDLYDRLMKILFVNLFWHLTDSFDRCGAAIDLCTTDSVDQTVAPTTHGVDFQAPKGHRRLSKMHEYWSPQNTTMLALYHAAGTVPTCLPTAGVQTVPLPKRFPPPASTAFAVVAPRSASHDADSPMSQTGSQGLSDWSLVRRVLEQGAWVRLDNALCAGSDLTGKRQELNNGGLGHTPLKGVDAVLSSAVCISPMAYTKALELVGCSTGRPNLGVMKGVALITRSGAKVHSLGRSLPDLPRPRRPRPGVAVSPYAPAPAPLIHHQRPAIAPDSQAPLNETSLAAPPQRSLFEPVLTSTNRPAEVQESLRSDDDDNERQAAAGHGDPSNVSAGQSGGDMVIDFDALLEAMDADHAWAPSPSPLGGLAGVTSSLPALSRSVVAAETDATERAIRRGHRPERAVYAGAALSNSRRVVPAAADPTAERALAALQAGARGDATVNSDGNANPLPSGTSPGPRRSLTGDGDGSKNPFARVDSVNPNLVVQESQVVRYQHEPQPNAPSRKASRTKSKPSASSTTDLNAPSVMSTASVVDFGVATSEERFSSYAGRHHEVYFQISASVKNPMKGTVRDAIRELGCTLLADLHYDPKATHLIAMGGETGVERTEKFLAFRAASKPIVTPHFVLESLRRGGGRLLHEEPFRAVPIEILPPLSRQPPFASWSVALFGQPHIASGITTILQAGGCREVYTPPFAHMEEWTANEAVCLEWLHAVPWARLTHIFIEVALPSEGPSDVVTSVQATTYVPRAVACEDRLSLQMLRGSDVPPHLMAPRDVTLRQTIASGRVEYFTLEYLFQVMCVPEANQVLVRNVAIRYSSFPEAGSGSSLAAITPVMRSAPK